MAKLQLVIFFGYLWMQLLVLGVSTLSMLLLLLFLRMYPSFIPRLPRGYFTATTAQNNSMNVIWTSKSSWCQQQSDVVSLKLLYNSLIKAMIFISFSATMDLYAPYIKGSRKIQRDDFFIANDKTILLPKWKRLNRIGASSVTGTQF